MCTATPWTSRGTSMASRATPRAASLQPFAHSVYDALERLARVLECATEPLAVVVVGLACLFLCVRLAVAPRVVTTDDAVVLTGADPVHQLGNAPHGVGVRQVQ